MARAAARTSLSVVSVIVGLAGLTSTARRAAPGTSSRRSSSRFAANSPTKKLIPVRLPPGRARLATRPSRDRVFGDAKDDRDRRCCRLGCRRRGGRDRRQSRRPAGEPNRPPAPAADQFDSRPSGIRSRRSRPRHSRFLSGPGEMRADAPQMGQAMLASRKPITGMFGCCARAAKRPRRRRAAQQRDELAPSHSITSSARGEQGRRHGKAESLARS